VRRPRNRIVPKGRLANELILELLVHKDQPPQPIDRRQAEWAEKHGMELSRKTLTDAVLAAGSLLQAVGGPAAEMAGRKLYPGRRAAAALPDADENGPPPPGVLVGIQRARRGGGV